MICLTVPTGVYKIKKFFFKSKFFLPPAGHEFTQKNQPNFPAVWPAIGNVYIYANVLFIIKIIWGCSNIFLHNRL